MKLCRFQHQDATGVALYYEHQIVPVAPAAEAYAAQTQERLSFPPGDNLLDLLPSGDCADAARKLASWIDSLGDALPDGLRLPIESVQLLVPIPRPNKLFLLAGNYAKHIEEGGGIAAERAETFPYVFMKPPTTTLTDPGRPIVIPAISPNTIDWELELAVVIGCQAKGISEDDALDVVAGYTIINDISNRVFRPNPNRKQREKDQFFDWLHGKWHDSFCPCGPCIASADSIPDPQRLDMELSVNGTVRQSSSTSRQIFPVAAVIEFISSFVTLEPGDIISTGTPAGVGHASRTYLTPDDQVKAHIDQIGTLHSTVEAE